SAVE
ncbi:hypothetical protein D030_3259B, partial [Vibrio parahaemolyticus AQ3810]